MLSKEFKISIYLYFPSNAIWNYQVQIHQWFVILISTIKNKDGLVRVVFFCMIKKCHALQNQAETFILETMKGI